MRRCLLASLLVLLAAAPASAQEGPDPCLDAASAVCPPPDKSTSDPRCSIRVDVRHREVGWYCSGLPPDFPRPCDGRIPDGCHFLTPTVALLV